MTEARSADETTVLIADDHPLLRRGLAMALSADASLRVIGEANDGVEALEQIRALNPAIALLDLDMPKLSGFGVARKLLEMQHACAVIILTLHTGSDLISEALELGVRGYMLKSSPVTDLIEGVRRVASGESNLGAGVRQILTPQPSTKSAAREDLEELSPTELMIVRRVARGDTSKEIAAALELSTRTVENYRTAICSKLGLTGPNALLRFAFARRDLLRDRKKL